ncbi:hypothetical protein Tsubulata_018165 [Turnera subulata]|uniref:Uncharacterized protein n=1 Tax=Turnera subulata TaxID=218843 RepID=A0A9Q0G087_9ROSI|nr:hypothetical protein Tsubulata_018165 [Turnera subulata]
MEEEIVSLISSDREASVTDDISDSNSCCQQSPPSKRTRNGNGIPTSKFKGVVPHQNGHWGCQIYANHQRIWLGTFKSENEAAMAYDSAAMKLRSGDLHRNFPFDSFAAEELNFQTHYTTEAVLRMIKEGSYPSKFADFISICSERVDTELSLEVVKSHNNRGPMRKLLFEKELTPSDVGKLNRLVIPKKFAVKFFPPIPEDRDENETVDDKVDDIQLTFYDKSMKLWKFRYCYWKSSQSYVFTRGWSRFVKANKLNSKDVVTFSLCESRENAEATQTFYMIDVISNQDSNALVGMANESNAMEMGLQLRLGQSVACDSCMMNGKQEEEMMETNSMAIDFKKNGLRLFGTRII